MVIKNTANLQSKIIAEMIELCRFQNYSIYKAARRVSGNDRFYNARADCQSLVKVSYKTVIRWYLHWFDFGMLPCQMKHKKGSNYNGTILKNLFGRNFYPSSICKRLRKLKYSRKVVYEKATQQIKVDKDRFIDTLRFHVKKPEMAIFIDEESMAGQLEDSK